MRSRSRPRRRCAGRSRGTAARLQQTTGVGCARRLRRAGAPRGRRAARRARGRRGADGARGARRGRSRCAPASRRASRSPAQRPSAGPIGTARELGRRAGPGEILLAPETRSLVRDAVACDAAGDGALRLVRLDPTAPGLVRRLDTPLVDRERELLLLETAFAHAAALLDVPPLHALRAGGDRQVAARRGARADALRARRRSSRGACLAYGEGITYWPVAEIVRRAAAAPTTPPRSRERLAALVPGPDGEAGRRPARRPARGRGASRAPTRSPGRCGACSRPSRQPARSSSSSTTSSTRSQRCSTCSKGSPTARAARRSCSPASPGRSCSSAAELGRRQGERERPCR